MEQSQKYAAARKQVEEEKGFYNHLIVYIIVIGSFWILNAWSNEGHWWAVWPTLGWGIGLFFHGFGVFGRNAVFSKRWEDRRMKQLLDKDTER